MTHSSTVAVLAGLAFSSGARASIAAPVTTSTVVIEASQSEPTVPRATRSADEVLSALRDRRQARDWSALLATWQSEHNSFSAASPAWANGCALALEAAYELWDVSALEQLVSSARASVDALREIRPADARTLSPELEALDFDARMLEARILQSRSFHERAVNILGPLYDRTIQSRQLPNTRFAARLCLDLGRSLIEVGRVSDGYQVLGEFAVHSAATPESGTAQVLLQRAPNGLANYWGKYRGHPAHRRLMEGVRAILPTAQKRLAETSGWKIDDLTAFPIGVADLPPGLGPMSALTTGDPRLPDFEPVIIVFSEALANDFEDPVMILAHELSHARLIAKLGLAYDAWPMWAAEGLPIALAGQSDDILFETLGFHLEANPEAFLGEHPEVLLRPRFRVDPFEPATMHVDSSGLAFWGLAHAPDELRSFVRALDEGATLAAAVKSVTKLELAEFVREAESTVINALLAERGRELDALRKLERARLSGWRDAVRVSNEVLASGCGRIARGYAMFLRARGTAEVGPLTDAIAASQALIDARREHKRLLFAARLGLGSCFTRAGRLAEARTELEALVRDSMGGNYAELAADMLRRLPKDKK